MRKGGQPRCSMVVQWPLRTTPVVGILLFVVWVSSTTQAQDFDGDGASDLAIGVPYENVSATRDAGSVSVIYGASTGLTGIGDEYWIQDYLVGSNSETYEYFGISLGDRRFRRRRFR
jgi:hypothetical protein